MSTKTILEQALWDTNVACAQALMAYYAAERSGDRAATAAALEAWHSALTAVKHAQEAYRAAR